MKSRSTPARSSREKMTPTEAVRWGCIIVAAGRGERFGGSLPKQFAPLLGRPLFSWSLETALSIDRIREVCLVLPQGEESNPEAAKHPRVRTARGGPRRRDSVANGLEALPGCTHILVHDAARPLASRPLFERVMQACEETGAAAPGVPVADTLKRVSDEVVEATVDRSGLWRSQTPQGFERGLLEEALALEGDFTDEAQGVELSGHPVRIVEGDEANAKITSRGDLALAERLAGPPRSVTRTGVGLDFHPFAEGRPLILCGCNLAGFRGLDGYSDGDAALHAVMDAILSATRLGDIGTLFPPSDPSYAGADSAVLTGRVLSEARKAGWEFASLDLTIISELPRISSLRQELRGSLAEILGVPLDSVWVKGTTTNSLGALGRGEGLGALAFVEMRSTGAGA